MSKFSKSLARSLRSCRVFLDRLLQWGSTNMGLCAIIVSTLGMALSFWGLARGMNWGAAQLGPLSSYLAAAATVTAVTVALRQSWQARKIADDAVEAARERAVVDRDFSHRKETTKQILDMWGHILNVQPDLLGYILEFRRSGPGRGKDYLEFLALVGVARSSIFAAEILAVNPVVVAQLKTLSDRFLEFEDALHSSAKRASNEEHANNVSQKWAEVVALQPNYPQLLRTHLPLLEGSEREADRVTEAQQDVIAEFNAAKDDPTTKDAE